jgi:hypothetical protein
MQYALDAGVKADGRTDDAPALSRALAQAVASGSDLTLPAGTLSLASTVLVRNAADLRVLGSGNRKTFLKWTGPAGAPVIRMVNCYRTVLENLSIEASPDAGALVIVQNDDTAKDYNLPSSLNVFRDLRLVGGEYGVRFALTPGAKDVMNDQSRFDRVIAARQRVAAVSIQGQNSKLHAFHECQFTDSPRAVLVEDAAGGGAAGGSFHWFGGYVVSSVTNFQIDGVSMDGVSIYSANSESSARFLTVARTDQTVPVNVIGCRFSAARLNQDGYALVLGAPGPYTILGSHWGEQLQRAAPRIRFLGAGPTSALIQSNVFGSLNSVATDPIVRDGAGPYDLAVRGNLFRTTSGATTVRP